MIDALSIKAAAQHLVLPIRHLVNTSLRTSEYATRWKIAKTVPLHKDKDLSKLDPASFRLIALLLTLSKLVERAAQQQILEYMEKTFQMNASCHAYRAGLSMTTSLTELMNGLHEGADNKKISSIMAIDQSSAFDCVGHRNLIEKLKLYNLNQEAVDWITSYLTGRTSYVQIGICKSRMVSISRGVPQGSVLGPLLYSIYTNDMTEIIKDRDCQDISHLDTRYIFGQNCETCGTLVIYADDATYRITSKNRANNQNKLRKKSRKHQ